MDEVVAGEGGRRARGRTRRSRLDLERVAKDDQRLEGRRDELAELPGRRAAEERRGVADEVLPELARRFLGLRRRSEAYRPLLEALRLERLGEGLLDDEDDPVPAAA
ncbi:MAG TPA: hypothetical protein VHE08_05775 [Solirubrobacterales bacterium]|nr:hypothetical protein [Solirubrobacterales bacterium]